MSVNVYEFWGDKKYWDTEEAFVNFQANVRSLVEWLEFLMGIGKGA